MQVKENVNLSNFFLVSNQTHSAQKEFGKSNFQIDDFAKCLDDSKSDFKTESEDVIQKNISEENNKFKNELNKSKETNETNETYDINENHLSQDEMDICQDIEQEEVLSNVELSDEDIQTIMELFGNVLQMVMDSFQLSEEEFVTYLKEFDMEPMDLLNADGLKEFFLNMNSSDISSLITNENLNMELQSFLDKFDSLLKDSDFTTEELQTFVQSDDFVNFLNSYDEFDNSYKDAKQDISNLNSETMEAKEPEVIVLNENSPKENTFSSHEKQNDSKSKKDLQLSDDKIMSRHENSILESLRMVVNRFDRTAKIDQPIQGRDIVNQIVEQIRVIMNQETTSMELQLYPEHLGKIQINVVSKDGVMTAKIVAETETAKQAIQSGLLNLKEAIQEQNLKIEAIEVMVSTMGFEKGNEEQKSFNEKNTSTHRRKIDLSEIDNNDGMDEEQLQMERMRAEGSSVIYTA